MLDMMHKPGVLLAMVAIAALLIVGLFIAGRFFSSRKTDRDYPGPSERPE